MSRNKVFERKCQILREKLLFYCEDSADNILVYICYTYLDKPSTLIINNHTIYQIKQGYTHSLVCFMVLSATFNNISVISWLSVLLVEETRGLEENHRSVASH